MCHSASFFNHSINSPSGPAIVSVSSGCDQMFMNVLKLFGNISIIWPPQNELHIVTCGYGLQFITI